MRKRACSGPGISRLERDEMRDLAAWLTAVVGSDWTHVKNEGTSHRACGVHAGVPDILIFRPPIVVAAGSGTGYCGAAIELKRVGGAAPSAAQLSWIEKLRSYGWAAAVCYGASASIIWLRGLGYGPQG